VTAHIYKCAFVGSLYKYIKYEILDIRE